MSEYHLIFLIAVAMLAEVWMDWMILAGRQILVLTLNVKAVLGGLSTWVGSMVLLMWPL